MSMGETAENVADKYGISREEMDRYALQSHMRAVLAGKDGIFAREIIPVPLLSGLTMTDDDGPRADTTLEKLATLRPVFRKGGRVTAGNSCPLNDGAAAAVVMSQERAEQLGIEQELADVERRYPAGHYVVVDDKLRILDAIKRIWKSRVTTVFVRQGHYAQDPQILAQYAPADINIDRIGDLLEYDLSSLSAASGVYSAS